MPKAAPELKAAVPFKRSLFLQIGEEITLQLEVMQENDDGGRAYKKLIKKKYTVVGVYPHFVRLKDERGGFACFQHPQVERSIVERGGVSIVQ